MRSLYRESTVQCKRMSAYLHFIDCTCMFNFFYIRSKVNITLLCAICMDENKNYFQHSSDGVWFFMRVSHNKSKCCHEKGPRENVRAEIYLWNVEIRTIVFGYSMCTYFNGKRQNCVKNKRNEERCRHKIPYVPCKIFYKFYI